MGTMRRETVGNAIAEIEKAASGLGDQVDAAILVNLGGQRPWEAVDVEAEAQHAFALGQVLQEDVELEDITLGHLHARIDSAQGAVGSVVGAAVARGGHVKADDKAGSSLGRLIAALPDT